MSLIQTMKPLLSSILPYSYIMSTRLTKYYTFSNTFSNTDDHKSYDYDYDPHIKKIYFGNRVLYFYIPDVYCDPAPDHDTDMSNPTIDPDTWMDIPPYD